ncbi:monosaccharide ABC transporter ATP-binding protein, CUT2 family [Thermomonospora echinospora]|uniref:Monosaccharide ABC transporter ATP-binding protein, CUT2 family n=1 Tax=Thermomonospora echinospora TaxID=1992 RepID=A0A1H6DSV0_9ACTN|nr:sugar ABC transporter ATP-binding protein [Thermomonospora echinospora]SEG87813.1 monosaccharide ABC transporter ATP-binding protein, CUT2 family [Thermomonospora echinospora]
MDLDLEERQVAPVLELREVRKAFGGAQALAGVDFTLLPGEVHAVVGMNGAGKSTLVEMICGSFAPDSGDILIDGERQASLTPRRAHAAGVSIVHQKRTLVDGLTVAENLLLGRLPTRAGRVLWKRVRQEAARALDGLGIDIAPDAVAGALGPAEQTLVEIAREVDLGGRVLVLDEPTASLGGRDAQRIHRLVRTLRDRGTAIVYISHHLDEVLDLADRITVMRDGRVATVVRSAELDLPALIRAMVGDRLVHERSGTSRSPGKPVLELAGLSGGRLHAFDLTVRAGEVVAVLGPAGDGQCELFRLLTGLRRAESGRVTVNDAEVAPGNVGASLAAGLRCITGDRLSYGLVPALSVNENLDLVRRGRRRPWLVRWRDIHAQGRQARQRYGVTTLQVDPPVSTLSGGNQQKVLLSAWLDGDPVACLLEEPTNGVDVAAKADIHRIVDDLADRGAAVLLSSSDVDEVVRLADRVVVVRSGRIVADLPMDRVTRDDLVTLTAGGEQT